MEHLPQASLIKGRFGGIVNMMGDARLCLAILELRLAEREQTEIDWRKHLLSGMYPLGLERSQKPRGDREGE